MGNFPPPRLNGGVFLKSRDQKDPHPAWEHTHQDFEQKTQVTMVALFSFVDILQNLQNTASDISVDHLDRTIIVP